MLMSFLKSKSIKEKVNWLLIYDFFDNIFLELMSYTIRHTSTEWTREIFR